MNNQCALLLWQHPVFHLSAKIKTVPVHLLGAARKNGKRVKFAKFCGLDGKHIK
jgi:hypothetical protein